MKIYIAKIKRNIFIILSSSQKKEREESPASVLDGDAVVSNEKEFVNFSVNLGEKV